MTFVLADADGEGDKELGSDAEVALAFPSAVLLVLAPADEAEVIGASVGNVEEEVVLLEAAVAFPSAVLLVLAPADEAEVIGASVGNVEEEVVLLEAAVALTPAAAAEGNAATGEVGEGLSLCRLSFPCPSPCA